MMKTTVGSMSIRVFGSATSTWVGDEHVTPRALHNAIHVRGPIDRIHGWGAELSDDERAGTPFTAIDNDDEGDEDDDSLLVAAQLVGVVVKKVSI